MTVLSRGARVRRGGRRPGWLLLTALLVLAIAASSALVFTNRVELLKLAVILALWAAVVAAFVSVIYRRQSDVDAARARDLKLVYDLQLDREISARREYELTVESQLRRELATELRAHAAEEVAALRAELAALRTNLEILFDAELNDRPALETERGTVRGYSDWDRENETARERINRVTSVRAEEPSRRTDDTIIDVPEEPLAPPPRQPAAQTYHAAYSYQSPDAYRPPEPPRGAHSPQDERAAQPDERAYGGAWAAGPGVPPARAGRQPDEHGWSTPNRFEPEPAQRPRSRHEAPPPSYEPPPPPEPPRYEPPTPPEPPSYEPPPQYEPPRFEPPPQYEPRFAPPPTPPQPQPEQGAPPARGGQQPGWSVPSEVPRHQDSATEWRPIGAEGQWLPPGTPGGNWITDSNYAGSGPDEKASVDNAPEGPLAPPHAEQRGRHASAAEPMPSRAGEPESDWGETGRRARARHYAEDADSAFGGSATPAPAMSPPPPPTPPPPPAPADKAPAMSPPAAPAARHRSTDSSSDADGPPTGSQSVADLLARLQATPSGGGRRRRREE